MRKTINKSSADCVSEMISRLEKLYPSAECALKYEGEPWKLLIMAILSAQCTDARVNIVSEALFRQFPTIYSVASGDTSEIESAVKSCGLYKTKAKNIKASCEIICASYGGEIPNNMDALLTLPGVGRKIANLIMGDIYGKPAIVTDTHCIRLSSRLGLTPPNEKNPLKTERALIKIIPPYAQSDFCHRLVLFGREYCTARSPKCTQCPLSDICHFTENPTV